MTLYEILGVKSDATDKEIKQAYRDKAKENHEDKGGNHEDMTEINKAWMVLRDPIRRDKYDKTGQTDNESFDFKFGQYVQTIFMNIVEQNDVDYKDLIGEFKAYNLLMIEQNEGMVVVAKDKLKKLEKVLKRLKGSGVMIGVVNNNIGQAKLEIGSLEEHIKFLRECGECLASCHYTFDEMPPEQTYTFSTFNFNVR